MSGPPPPTVRGSTGRWLPVAASLAALLASVLLWQVLRAGEARHAGALALAQAAGVRDVVAGGFRERLLAVTRMARRWELHGSRTREEFELEAAVNQESFPSMRAMGWVGPDLVVTWVSPRRGNEAALGVRVNAEPVRAGTYARARATGAAVLSPPVRLVQGGTGILAIAPIAVAGRDAGYVYAAIDPAALLGRLLAGVGAGHAVRVEAAGAPVFAQGSPEGPAAAALDYELGGIGWRVSVWLPPEAGTPLPELVLAVSAALSLVLGLALRAGHLAWQRARIVEASAAEIRATERRYRFLAETIPQIVWTANPGGALDYANPRWREVTGTPPESVLGAGWERFLHPDDVAQTAERWTRSLAAGEPYEVEHRLRTRDGSYRWFRTRAAPLRDEGGAIVMWIGTAVDFDDERRALEAAHASAAALRESERLLLSVIDQAADPIFVKDREGRFLLANQRTAEIFGVARAAIPGRRDADFLPPDAVAVIERVDRAVLERQETVVVEETIPEAGRPRVYLTAKSPLLGADGAVAGLVGVARDITDRKRAEEEVRRLNRVLEDRVAERTRQLADANAELKAFAHSVAHDLRAPLRAMSGFSDALREDYGPQLDATARDYLGRIAEAALRMDALIQDLLAYSRISREELALAPVPLDACVADAVAQLGAALRETGAAVEVAAPLPIVAGHRAVLTQVVANLVSNAVKFVGPGVPPRVKVMAERRGQGRVRLWVEDNGIGVAPEHRDRIFQVFQRLHGVADYPGTGIGLAIVRRGVERMGGAAGMEPGAGGGSRFWIELPEAA
ncbi:MAG TPA: PAS domain S-box protein [Azospirillaceae bacterium]|nr:PAS domain S-box protein [Azospirillaceae bacterium]